MQKVNMQQAKSHFSKLIDAVIHGEEIIIAMAGKPVAKLIPIFKKPVRRLGVLKNKIKIAKDFDESEFIEEAFAFGKKRTSFKRRLRQITQQSGSFKS